jgi:hypothetical protein
MHQGSFSPIPNATAKASSLTNTAQTLLDAVSGAVGGTDVLGVHIRGGAAAEVVIFRAVDDTPEYFRVPIAANGFEELKLPFRVARSEGLEVLTADTAGDVEVVLFYYVPGAKGIGV